MGINFRSKGGGCGEAVNGENVRQLSLYYARRAKYIEVKIEFNEKYDFRAMERAGWDEDFGSMNKFLSASARDGTLSVVYKSLFISLRLLINRFLFSTLSQGFINEIETLCVGSVLQVSKETGEQLELNCDRKGRKVEKFPSQSFNLTCERLEVSLEVSKHTSALLVLEFVEIFKL